MNPSTDTQVLSRPPQENASVQLLNDIWLLTIVAVIIGTGVPWIASNFQVNFAGASVGLLALGAVHVAQTLLGTPLRQQANWHMKAMTALEVAGVVLIGFIWDHVGALQNPLFLMVFVLPIMGAIFLSRWHPYLLATVSLVTVGFVSLREAPELRWFASGLVGNDTWLVWLFGRNAAASDPSFSGFSAPLNYLVVLLEVFAISLIACAVAAEYVGLIFGRLNENTAIARGEAERGEELWSRLIDHLPLPALLIDPISSNIIAASHSAMAYLRPANAVLEGANLFEVLKLSYPDVVQELIAGADGEASPAVLRVGEDLRLTRVKVLHVMHKERRLALLTVEDGTEIFCVRSALDTSEYAAVVVDGKGRVLTFNKLVVGLLGNVEAGMEAARLLPQPDQGLRWWEPGLTGRRKSHLQIGSRVYQLTTSAVSLPGEEASIYAVSFLPVASGTAADTDGTASTLITGTLRQLR
jgi:PAS domain-containing protein